MGYLSININFILPSKSFPTGGINYTACNIASKSSSATRAVYTSDGNHYLQPVSAYTNRLGGANNPYSEEVYDTATHSYSNASMYPAISTYTTGGTSTSKAFPTGGINYTVCNIGATCAESNVEFPTVKMPTECRFHYYGTYYTSLPCYIPNGTLNRAYLSPSLDSNGATITAWTGYGSFTYYPAISTYGLGWRYKLYSM